MTICTTNLVLCTSLRFEEGFLPYFLCHDGDEDSQATNPVAQSIFSVLLLMIYLLQALLASGYSHGNYLQAQKVASDVLQVEYVNIRANSVTFLGILNGCSHNGLVNEGLEYFRMMNVEYGIVPDIKHYGCLIDMFGRSGRVEEAEVIAEKIPSEFDSVVVWRTLLGACFLHGNVKVGERVKDKINEIEKKYGGDYVLLSNIFADFGMFTDSESVRKSMNDETANKVPGFSISGL